MNTLCLEFVFNKRNFMKVFKLFPNFSFRTQYIVYKYEEYLSTIIWSSLFYFSWSKKKKNIPLMKLIFLNTYKSKARLNCSGHKVGGKVWGHSFRNMDFSTLIQRKNVEAQHGCQPQSKQT